ncbi:MAG: cupin domain-containing protein [Candidatus Arcticimaribacter sp.]
MKSLLISFCCYLLTSSLWAQDITEFPKGNLAPNVHHSGKVWLNFLSQTNDNFPYNMVVATMAAGAKLDWHSHAKGQQLVVTSGMGFYQERGKEVQIIRQGDVINTTPAVDHWHSATPTTAVAYLAIYPPDPTQWEEPIDQAFYESIVYPVKTLKEE